ncbi:hypothetical protein KAW50_06020, partial [candidate division WOR-3 bacterium]|nr:hypothetical protein [candidate division WOR-3 bacterium]
FLDKFEAKSKIGASATIGIVGKVRLAGNFALESGADYFKAKSPDEKRSLLLVPIDTYLSYRYMILPGLVYFYVGGGYNLCFTKYEEESCEISGWGSGPAVKANIEFLPTPNLGVELWGGYRFATAPDIELKDAENKNPTMIPMNLWGGFLKIVIKREI